MGAFLFEHLFNSSMQLDLATIRRNVRTRTDTENSDFISDAEIDRYANASIAELYDIVIGSYGDDYFRKEFNIFTEAGVSVYPLSASRTVGLTTTTYDDFYKLLGVDFVLTPPSGAHAFTDASGLEKRGIRRLGNFAERNRYNNQSGWNYSYNNVRYMLKNENEIQFFPPPVSQHMVVIHYIPCAPTLTSGSAGGESIGTQTTTESIDVFNAWGEYVIVDVCIKVAQKEESDTRVFQQQKIDLRERIRSMAPRNASEPARITDVYVENDIEYWRRT